MFIVYSHRNTVNGKYYIGLTSQGLNLRWYQHTRSAYTGSKLKFHRAIRKYTDSVWESNIIHAGITTIEKASELEQLAIAQYDSYSNGYNSTLGGHQLGTVGFKHSASMRKYLSVAKLKFWSDMGTSTYEARCLTKRGENNPMHGKTHSDMSRFTMSLHRKHATIPPLESCEFSRAFEEFCKITKKPPAYSLNIRYTFINDTLDIVEECSQAYLVAKYLLDYSCLSKVVKGRRTHHKGWYMSNKHEDTKSIV